jgi:hypothetical protein
VDVRFDSDQGPLSLNGRVESVQGNRVLARVRGGELDGTMELNVTGNDRVRRISMSDSGRNRYQLNWRD